MPDRKFTLCWDCKRATGGCRWSDSLTPVKGWYATMKRNSGGITYVVHECPEFVRDAINNGLKRYEEDDPLCKALETGTMTT